MRLIPIALAVVLFALGGCGDGCCCGDDCDPVLPPSRLVITSPLNGSTVTAADDEDPLTAGINITVEVAAQNIPDGAMVTLTNSAGGSSGPIPLTEGRAAFSGVTLTEGDPPAGRVNELTAETPNAASDTIALTVIGQAGVSCHFVAPLAGARLTEDSNANLEYFQTDVVVACSGNGISSTAAVELSINGAAPRQANLSAGTATFTGVTLAEGSNTLAAHALDSSGSAVGAVAIWVEVDTGRCDATISAPPSSTLNAQTADLVTATPDVLDIDLTVLSTRCPSGSVQLEVNGISNGSGTLSGGTGQIRVALPQGNDAVVAIVDDGAGPRDPGRSLPTHYGVDTLGPIVTVNRPPADAVLGAADDEESPPNPANGLTYTVAGMVANPEDSTLSVDVLRDGTALLGSPFAVTVNPTSGAFSRTFSGLLEGSYELDFYAIDPAGNIGTLVVNFTVVLEAPELTAVISSDLDGDDVLNLAEDAVAGGSYEIAVAVAVTSVSDPTQWTAVVTAQPVDGNGDPAGTPVVGSQQFAAGGAATVTLTLTANGRYNVTALARNGAGNDSLPTADHFVRVDFTPPDLVIVQPAQQTIQAARSVTVIARTLAADFAASSPAIAINAVPVSGATAVVNAGTITYPNIALTGATSDVYTIVVSISDTAGNPATAQSTVTVDDVPPTLEIRGWASDRATTRDRALSTTSGSPTLIDATSDDTLDYATGSAGLQYGFKVLVDGETVQTIGGTARVRLDVQGWAQPFFAPVADNAGQLEAVVDAAGAGITLDDGPLTIAVALDDVAGNHGADARFVQVKTGTRYVRIDSPEEGAAVNSATLDVAASADLGGANNRPCQLRVNGTLAATVNLVAGVVDFTNVALGSAGSYQLVVSCDVDGSTTVTSLVRTVVVDTTAPTGLGFVVSAGSVAGAIPESGFFNLDWNNEDGSEQRFLRSIDVRVGAEGGVCDVTDPTLTVTPLQPAGTPQVFQAIGPSGGKWILQAGGTECAAEFVAVDLALGADPGQSLQLTVDVTDLAGNAAQATADLVVDRLAPALTQEFPAAGVTALGSAYDEQPATAGLQMTGPKAWRFTIGDRALVGDVTLTYSGTASGSATATATAGTVTISTNWAADGDYVVTIEVADEAGNTTRLGPTTFTVDLAAPGVLLADKDGRTMADVLHEYGPLSWGQASDVDTAGGGQFDFTLRVDGVQSRFDALICSDNPPAGATTACQAQSGFTGYVVASISSTPSGGIGLVQFGAVNLPQGTHHIYAEATDQAGNRAATEPVAVAIDTIPPQFASISLSRNAAANDTACAPGLCLAIGEQPSDIVVSINTAGDNEDVAGRLLTLTSDLGGQIGQVNLVGTVPNFIATFTSVTLIDGTHHLSVAVSDAIGNAATTTGAVNPELYVDTVAPTITGHAPMATAQYSSATFDVSVLVADGAAALAGTRVDLFNLTASTQISSVIAVGNNAAQFNAVAMLDNRTNSMMAQPIDRVGNTGNQVSFSYDVDSTAPAVTRLTPAAETNLSGTGGSCLDSNIFSVAIAGLNRTATTRIQLQSRAWGSTGAFGVVQASDRAVTADSSNFVFDAPPPCFESGSREVRARIYETDTDHEQFSTAVRINVDLGTPVVTIYSTTGNEVTNAYAFLSGEDTNPTVGAYSALLTVEAPSAAVASLVRLFVNGIQVGGDQSLNSSHRVTFAVVPLLEYASLPEGNTIRAEVGTGPTQGVRQVIGCRADGDAPTVAFTSTAAKTYVYADDTNHASGGVQAATGNGIGFTTSGAEGDAPAAHLLCSGAGSFDLAFPGAARDQGEFTDLPGLITASSAYNCTLTAYDATGNDAVSAVGRAITVDIDPPASPVVIACLGEDTGSQTYEMDDNSGIAKCFSGNSGACADGVGGVDSAKCSRRATNIALTWVAPGDNGVGGGRVTSYTIRYGAKAITASPSCASGDLTTTANTSGLTIVDPGAQQSAVVGNLSVHKDYCFEVTAVDAQGNSAASTLALRRAPLVVAHTETGTGATFGRRVSLSGDIDGDGNADLVIGEPGYQVGATANAGRAVVHFSSSAHSNKVITAATGRGASRFGRSVSTGDVNGDGFSDVLIGESDETSYNGRVYVYFGSAGGLVQAANSSDASLPSLTPDVVIAADFTGLGWALASRPLNLDGDVNGGNRFDDIVVFGWAPPSYYVPTVFVYRGRATWPASVTTTGDHLGADMDFRMTDGSYEIVITIAGADFDADGHDDLAIPVFNSSGIGHAYVVYGRATLPATLAPASGAGEFVFTLTSPNTTANFGTSAIAYEGSGDGAADLAVFDNTNGGRRVHFYRGTVGQKVALAGGDTNFVSLPSLAALAPETLGDVTGDGVPDLFVGDSATGVAQFYAGGASGVETTAAATFERAPEFGFSAAGGGDYDGDGFDDLAVSDSAGSGSVAILR